MATVVGGITPQKQAVVIRDAAAHFIFVLDCSGSMGGVMGQMRAQLKQKLPQLTKPGDLVSIVWFSSRSEWGVLQAGFPIANVASLPQLNATIDKWLRAMNMTGFVEPLNAIPTLVADHSQPGMVNRLFFLTDGQDNQWQRSQIMAAINAASGVVNDVTIVEMGYYCNHTLLVDMAAAAGGSLLFAEDFSAYDGHFTSVVSGRKGGVNRIELYASGATDKAGFYVQDGAVYLVDGLKQTNGYTWSVPENIEKLYFYTDKGSNDDETGAYAGLYVAVQRMDTPKIYDLLGKLGDTALIDQFATCFSRQDYARLEATTITCVLSPTERYALGKDYNRVPAVDAYTMLDLLDLLTGVTGNLFHPYNPAFAYERISRGSVDAGSVLSDTEKDALLEQVKAIASMADVEALAAQLAALRANKHVLKFVPDEPDPGCTILDLVLNEDRPNVSILIKIEGTVDLGELAPAGVPQVIRTFIYRNYALVKDGIRHAATKALPFTLSAVTHRELKARGLVAGEWEAGCIYIINADLPVINRQMVKAVDAKTVFTKAVQLIQFKAIQKVLNTFWKEKFERISAGWEAMYGTDTVTALKELGLTEWGGFAPKTVQAPAVDVYTAKTLAIKVKGLSTLPTVNDKLLDKVRTGGKLTPSETLMAAVIKRHDDFLASKIYTDAANQEALYRAWLEGERNAAKQQVRTLARELAQVRMTMLIGHIWFNEFANLDEGTLTVSVDGIDYVVTATLSDLEVKV